MRGLGPGSRVLLVLLGLALFYLAADRAGWLPGWAPRVMPRRVDPAQRAGAWGAVRAEDFAFRAGGAGRPGPIDGCPQLLRILSTDRAAVGRLVGAVPPGAAPGFGLAVELAAGPREALFDVATADAAGAVVSVSELVAAWPQVGDRAPRIVAVVAGSSNDLALVAPDRYRTAGDLAGSRVAWVPDTAAAYAALATLARAGVAEDVRFLEAASSEQALNMLAAGEADAVAAPLHRVRPLNLEGKTVVLPAVEPTDPVVLVMVQQGPCADAAAAAVQAGAGRASPEGASRAAEVLRTDLRFVQAAWDETRPPSGGAEVVDAWYAAERVWRRAGRLGDRRLPGVFEVLGPALAAGDGTAPAGTLEQERR